MSNGVYGTVRPADISPNDCEVFLHYTPSRGTIGNTELTKLDPNDVLIKMENPNNTSSVGEIFGGLYTLKLPATTCSVKGIYTVVIKPKEIRTTIVDCGVLAAYPNIKGIILDPANIPADSLSNFENGNLTGYRVEYITLDPTKTDRKVSNFFRIVTSNNKVSATQTNLSNSNQKAVRYRLDDNSDKIFLTLTPSSSPNVKPNSVPYIGTVGQEIIITNTFFNPIMVEIEMVEYDIESIAIGMYGPQSKSLEDGIYTNYNFKDEIYKQSNLYEIKDQFNGKPLFEVKEPRTNIDFTKDFNTVTNI